MNKLLLSATMLLFSAFAFAQNSKLVVPIVKTGETYIDIEEEINGEDVVVDSLKISISTDDAEQENDAMDTMIDDDIDAGWEGDDFNILTAGLRFQNITIPAGAVIDSAFIYVTSHEAKSAEDVTILNIYADADVNAPTFNMDALITDRTATSSSVKWTINYAWGLWTEDRTPDLKAIVQEMIDKEGWASGNPIAFIFKGTDEQGASEFENAREWESFENIADPEDGGDGVNHSERVPKLEIYYTAPSYELVIPIVKTGETYIDIEEEINGEDVVVDSLKIDISTDDVEQENDAMDTMIDDDIDAGWEGDDFNVLNAGFRFQNVTIPQGAIIESAYIEVTSHEAKSAEDVAILNIYANATDNAPTFTMDALITDRPLTSATVKWTIAEEWGLWTSHQTPELKSIVQEMVNRAGWTSGNAMAFILKGTDEQGASEFENAREMESFENIADPEDGGDGVNHQERVPKLHVTFTLATPAKKVQENAFRVYPSPASGSLNIQLEQSSSAIITLYNQLGQAVKQLNTNQASNQIQVEDLAAGVYFVQVKQNNATTTQKVILN